MAISKYVGIMFLHFMYYKLNSVSSVATSVEVLNERVSKMTNQITALTELIDTKVLKYSLFNFCYVVHSITPLQADRAELEAAVAQLREELDNLNIEESMSA